MDAMGRTIRALEPAAGIEAVIMPGDRGHAKERAARAAGEIEIAQETLRDLAGLAG